MKKFILAISIVGCLSSQIFAVEDTPENRAAQADRYLAVAPPKELMDNMVQRVSQNMPESSRGQFVDALTKNLNMEVITKAMKDALIKTFTADELSAFADFYGSPNGKSAMSKLGLYMAAVMPTIQQEVTKAMQNSTGTTEKKGETTEKKGE
jgi:hypothetical protein